MNELLIALAVILAYFFDSGVAIGLVGTPQIGRQRAVQKKHVEHDLTLLQQHDHNQPLHYENTQFRRRVQRDRDEEDDATPLQNMQNMRALEKLTETEKILYPFQSTGELHEVLEFWKSKGKGFAGTESVKDDENQSQETGPVNEEGKKNKKNKLFHILIGTPKGRATIDVDTSSEELPNVITVAQKSEKESDNLNDQIKDVQKYVQQSGLEQKQSGNKKNVKNSLDINDSDDVTVYSLPLYKVDQDESKSDVKKKEDNNRWKGGLLADLPDNIKEDKFPKSKPSARVKEFPKLNFDYLFDKNGILYLTKPVENDDHELKTLMNKVIQYKSDQSKSDPDRPLFTKKELKRLHAIAKAVTAEEESEPIVYISGLLKSQ